MHGGGGGGEAVPPEEGGRHGLRPRNLPGHLGKIVHLPHYLPVSHGEGGIPAFLQDTENNPDAAALGPEASVPPTVTRN